MSVGSNFMSQEEIVRLYRLLEKHFSDKNLISEAEQKEFEQLVGKAARINEELPGEYLERELMAYQEKSKKGVG